MSDPNLDLDGLREKAEAELIANLMEDVDAQLTKLERKYRLKDGWMTRQERMAGKGISYDVAKRQLEGLVAMELMERTQDEKTGIYYYRVKK